MKSHNSWFGADSKLQTWRRLHCRDFEKQGQIRIRIYGIGIIQCLSEHS
jgi:hypothetical protein